MKRLIAAMIRITVILAVVWGAGRVYFSLTDGFSLSNVTADSSYKIDVQKPAPVLSVADERNINHILNQPFKYLAKGCQFYTFLSHDGQYVLKFFKQKHLKVPFWVQYMPSVGQKVIEKKRKKTDILYSSCLLAYEELPLETGLILVHLSQTDFINSPTLIIDKMSFRHHVNLNQMDFIIQKAAHTVYGRLNALMEVGQAQEARFALNQLKEVIEKRCDKGIADCDPAFAQNMGFGVNNGEAMIIDIGQFIEDKELKNRNSVYREEDVRKRTQTLVPWLNAHYPALLPFPG